MKRETKFPWWGWLGILCLLPVIYVLSVFPVGWTVQHFGWEYPDGFKTFYSPLICADEEWVWVRDVMTWIGERVGVT
jgi:hypothetical protein